MKKHQKFSIIVLIITVVAFFGIRIYIQHLDDEVQRNLEEIEQVEEYIPDQQV
jgi:hypothetical protein